MCIYIFLFLYKVYAVGGMQGQIVVHQHDTWAVYWDVCFLSKLAPPCMAGGYMDTVLYEINTGGWNYKGNSKINANSTKHYG